MAGRKKQVPKKDYDALIKASEEKIEKLSSELKEERTTLKKLKKDKERFEAQLAEEEEQQKKEEIVRMIWESGKTLDEIKALLEK